MFDMTINEPNASRVMIDLQTCEELIKDAFVEWDYGNSSKDTQETEKYGFTIKTFVECLGETLYFVSLEINNFPIGFAMLAE